MVATEFPQFPKFDDKALATIPGIDHSGNDRNL
jgi:hypothetical protein